VNNVGQAFYDEKRKYLLPYREEIIVNNFAATLKSTGNSILNR
jgi:hypothetical protein